MGQRTTGTKQSSIKITHDQTGTHGHSVALQGRGGA